MTIVASGALRSGDELSGDGPSPTEAFYFTLGDQIVSGSFLHREPFEGAEWDGSILRVRLGSLVLMIEPS